MSCPYMELSPLYLSGAMYATSSLPVWSAAALPSGFMPFGRVPILRSEFATGTLMKSTETMQTPPSTQHMRLLPRRTCFRDTEFLTWDTEYQAPIAVTIIFIDTVVFDEERTRNDCVTVVDGVESVTGDTQHVADAFATAALHAGGEEKTPDGNMVDPTLAKKMSVV